MSKIEINNPLNKSIFKVFLTQLINIQFFKEENDHKKDMEDLKNLLFPPEVTDEDFNKLVSFVTKVIDKLIKTEKELEEITNELNEEFIYPLETFNETITIVEAQKEDIISHLNKDFIPKNVNKLDKMSWNTKIILQGNSDNFYDQKFCDIQFAYHNNEMKIKHKNITFFKNDINKILKEFNNIKNNLDSIKGIQ